MSTNITKKQIAKILNDLGVPKYYIIDITIRDNRDGMGNIWVHTNLSTSEIEESQFNRFMIESGDRWVVKRNKGLTQERPVMKIWRA